MDINRSYQVLADNIAHGKYGYIEIQGYEGRDPENLLEIDAYSTNDSHEVIACSHLKEEQRESVKEVATKHGLEIEELPDRASKSKVQMEFEEWIESICMKELDQLSHYDRAIKFAKELSHGVVRGYWENLIAKPLDLPEPTPLIRNTRRTPGQFNAGQKRLFTYMIDRIGHGTRSGQSYITKRGSYRYHGDEEVGDIDLMIGTMVGIGMLTKQDELDGNRIYSTYELTREAFDLLRTEPTELEELSRKQLKVERRLLVAIVAQAIIAAIAAAFAAVAALPQIERIISFIRSQQ